MREIARNLFSKTGLTFAFWAFFVEIEHREALGACMHRKANYYLFCSTSKKNQFLCTYMNLVNEGFQN